jgi:hypothetical protein
MRGFPHSYDPEKAVMEELRVGVTLSGRSPMMRVPMKRDPEGCEAKGRGLDTKHIKPYETRTPETLYEVSIGC